MVRWPVVLIASLCSLAFLIGIGPTSAVAQFADAQENAAPAEDSAGDAAEQNAGVALLSADELLALVAPVALYPDDLLAIVLPATTNPLQVVEAQRFLEKQKADASLQPDADWDPAILALLNYPEVVQKMNDDLDWTQQLGNALMDQQKDVLDAIQAARASAADANYLQSNDQQTVVNEGDHIIIQSEQPEVIYVPTYDPQPIVEHHYTDYPPPVYSSPYPYYNAPVATFFAGAFVGAAFAYGFDWNNDNIDIDNDINISGGDTNIGNGNNIGNGDRNKVEHRFNGDRKAAADGKMKWSPEKARQNSTAPRKAKNGQAKSKPTSANISKQLGAQQNRVKPNKATQQQNTRGSNSLSGTGKSKQQLQKSAADKQQLQRRKQQPQKQLQQRQLKQSSGGAFKKQSNKQQVKKQSNRGGKSLKSSGQSRPRRR